MLCLLSVFVCMCLCGQLWSKRNKKMKVKFSNSVDYIFIFFHFVLFVYLDFDAKFTSLTLSIFPSLATTSCHQIKGSLSLGNIYIVDLVLRFVSSRFGWYLWNKNVNTYTKWMIIYFISHTSICMRAISIFFFYLYFYLFLLWA